ncbi:MAG: hypothetical protein ACREA9_07660, partial [Pyrinomonadaceae bacterium]
LWRSLFFTMLTVLAIALNLNYASAQEASSTRNDLLTDERFAPGEALSAGKNTTPVGSLKAISYRLEKVKLRKPFETAEPNGTKRQLETAFRIKITLDSPPNNDYFIWIDDVPCRAYPSGYEAVTGENSVSFLLFSPTVPFNHESTLAISTYSRKFELTTLPEKLLVPADVRRSPVSGGARLQIKSIRSALIVSGKKARPVVWITIGSPFSFPVMNSVPTLEIWDKTFAGGTNGDEASFMMGLAEFAALKDGAQVILNGPGPIGGTVGRLNKSMLDKSSTKP